MLLMSTHNMFLLRTEENYPRIITKYFHLTSPLASEYLWWMCVLYTAKQRLKNEFESFTVSESGQDHTIIKPYRV